MSDGYHGKLPDTHACVLQMWSSCCARTLCWRSCASAMDALRRWLSSWRPSSSARASRTASSCSTTHWGGEQAQEMTTAAAHVPSYTHMHVHTSGGQQRCSTVGHACKRWCSHGGAGETVQWRACCIMCAPHQRASLRSLSAAARSSRSRLFACPCTAAAASFAASAAWRWRLRQQTAAVLSASPSASSAAATAVAPHAATALQNDAQHASCMLHSAQQPVTMQQPSSPPAPPPHPTARHTPACPAPQRSLLLLRLLIVLPQFILECGPHLRCLLCPLLSPLH